MEMEPPVMDGVRGGEGRYADNINHANKRTHAHMDLEHEQSSYARPSKRLKLSDGQRSPTVVPRPGLSSSGSESRSLSHTGKDDDLSIGMDLSLRRLVREPGLPILPGPKAVFRANWTYQLQKSQEQQQQVLDRLSQVHAGTVEWAPMGSPIANLVYSRQPTVTPFAPPAAATKTILRRTSAQPLTKNGGLQERRVYPVGSVPSSPLTEQSDSGMDEDLEIETESRVRSPRFNLHERAAPPTRGTTAKRSSKVRIQSTPPSDIDEQPRESESPRRGESPSMNDRTTTAFQRTSVPAQPVQIPVPVIVAAVSTAPSRASGPPKFRKWLRKNEVVVQSVFPPSSPSATPQAPTPLANGDTTPTGASATAMDPETNAIAEAQSESRLPSFSNVSPL